MNLEITDILRDIAIAEEGEGLLINGIPLYRTSLKKRANTASGFWIYSFSRTREDAKKASPRVDYYVDLRPKLRDGGEHLPFIQRTATGYTQGILRENVKKRESGNQDIVSVCKVEDGDFDV